MHYRPFKEAARKLPASFAAALRRARYPPERKENADHQIDARILFCKSPFSIRKNRQDRPQSDVSGRSAHDAEIEDFPKMGRPGQDGSGGRSSFRHIMARSHEKISLLLCRTKGIAAVQSTVSGRYVWTTSLTNGIRAAESAAISTFATAQR